MYGYRHIFYMSSLGKNVQKFSVANEEEKNEYLLAVQKNSFKKVKFS